MVTVNKCLTALALAFGVTGSPRRASRKQRVIRSARHALLRRASARYWLSRALRNTIRVPFHSIRIQLAWPNTAKDHELFLQITDTAPRRIPPRATCLLFLETPTAGPRGDYCRSRPHTRG